MPGETPRDIPVMPAASARIAPSTSRPRAARTRVSIARGDEVSPTVTAWETAPRAAVGGAAPAAEARTRIDTAVATMVGGSVYFTATTPSLAASTCPLITRGSGHPATAPMARTAWASALTSAGCSPTPMGPNSRRRSFADPAAAPAVAGSDAVQLAIAGGIRQEGGHRGWNSLLALPVGAVNVLGGGLYPVEPPPLFAAATCCNSLAACRCLSLSALFFFALALRYDLARAALARSRSAWSWAARASHVSAVIRPSPSSSASGS